MHTFHSAASSQINRMRFYSRLVLLVVSPVPGSVVMAPGVTAQSAEVVADNRAQNSDDKTSFDLSPVFARWGLGLKSQRRRDTCAVFTVTGALEFALSKYLGDGAHLSEEYLNWAANQVAGEKRDGATFPELERAFQKWGIAEESEMPYVGVFDSSYTPSEYALGGAQQVWELKPKWNWIKRAATEELTNAHIDAIKRILRRGFPVCAGGEHCMLIVAYSDEARVPGGGFFLARDYATGRVTRLNYAQTQQRFQSLLWIEFPKQTVK